MAVTAAAAVIRASSVAAAGAKKLELCFPNTIQSTLHLLTQFIQLPYEVGIMINVHFTTVPATVGIISVLTDIKLGLASSSSVSLRLRCSHLTSPTPLVGGLSPLPYAEAAGPLCCIRSRRGCDHWWNPELAPGSPGLLTPFSALGMYVLPIVPAAGDTFKDTAQKEQCAVETLWTVHVTQPSQKLYVNFSDFGRQVWKPTHLTVTQEKPCM